MKVERIKASPCPGCGSPLSGVKHHHTDGRSPKPGDYSVCQSCFVILRFTEDLGVRRVTSAELDELDPETRGHVEGARAELMGQRAATVSRVDAAGIRLQNGDTPEIMAAAAEGRAALIGPLASGPCPPRMQPATGRPCGRCKRAVWIYAFAPKAAVLCADCAALWIATRTEGMVD